MEVAKRNPNHPGATHYIIHAFDDPVHAPLRPRRRVRLREDRPGGVARRPHADAHLHPARDVERGGASERAGLQHREGPVPARRYARRSCRTRATGGSTGFLQLGDYAGARERIGAFEELLKTTKHPRAVGALALVNARYIIETEEWKVQPVADDASAETILANGMSAVRTGDLATAEKMAGDADGQGRWSARCRQRRRPRRSRRRRRRPPPAATNPDAGKGDRSDARWSWPR